MKQLSMAINVLKDCCIKREIEKSKYQQIFDLLPLNEKNNLENSLNTSDNIKINRNNTDNTDNINENVINIENNKNEHKDIFQEKNINENIKDVYCAYGKLHNYNRRNKYFEVKKIEIIPKYEKEENVMKSFSVVSISGNEEEIFFENSYTNNQYINYINKHEQKEYNSYYNDTYNFMTNEDYFFYNNYEQFFFIKAYDFKITCLISGIGVNSITICDNVMFFLLKNILTNMKYIYYNKKTWSSEQIQYILLTSVNDTNNYVKLNFKESFQSGCSVCIISYSKKYHILNVLNIGNILSILAKKTENKKKQFETIIITKSHDILNEEEKKRILSYGSILNNDLNNVYNNTWSPNLNKNFDNKSIKLKNINITKAIGLFDYNSYGLSNIPDIIEVQIDNNTNGYLILVSSTISKVFNAQNIIDYIFNESNKNESLIQISKNLIHKIHSIYMSTENRKIKDMSLIIVPLEN